MTMHLVLLRSFTLFLSFVLVGCDSNPNGPTGPSGSASAAEGGSDADAAVAAKAKAKKKPLIPIKPDSSKLIE
jgi:hypothetical protein